MTESLALAIGDFSVRQLDGLFSLNDLHVASGGEEKHRPQQFMRIEQTQALIAEIQSSNAQISAFETKRGNNGGTYACRELVIAYAAWISAAFHLKVIRVFLNATAPAIPDCITPAQKQHLQELVLLIVESGKQGHAETWSRLCRKFKVNKYELLHPSQFDAACEYLKGKMDDQSISALVKKHFPTAVASLPAPEASIDVKALLLKGQDAEPVAIPPEVEQAIDKQAWILAHDAYALLREHMRKRMAYSHTKGYPVKTLDTRSALAAIKTLTLGAALAHTAHSEMKYALGAIRTALHAAEDAQARVQEQIVLNFG